MTIISRNRPPFGEGGSAIVYAGETVTAGFRLQQPNGAGGWVAQSYTGRTFGLRVYGDGGATLLNIAGTLVNHADGNYIACVLPGTSTDDLSPGAMGWEFAEFVADGRIVISGGSFKLALGSAAAPPSGSGAGTSGLTVYTLRTDLGITAIQYIGAPGADSIATAADRVQTGLDRVQTGIDRIATAASVLTVDSTLDMMARASLYGVTDIALSLGFARTGIEARFVEPYYRTGLLGSTATSAISLAFSRASAGVALNLAGAFSTFSTGVMRRTDRGVLVEAARTNFARWSQDLTNAVWVPTGTVTRTANDAIAPDGTMTATRIQQGSAASLVGAATNGNPTSTAVVLSFWAKGVSAGQVIASRSGITGAAVPHTLTTSWQRFTWAFTSAASTEVMQFSNNAYGGGTVTATATQDFHIWGVQLEVAGPATSYIATTTASATRAADTLSSPVSISGSQDFLAFAEVSLAGTSPAEQRLFSIDAGSTADRVFVSRTAAGLVGGTVTVASADTVMVTTSKTGARTLKVALRRVGTSYQVFVDGVALAASTVAAMPTLTTLFDGHGRGNTAPLNDYLRSRVVLLGTFTDAQCVQITT